ncbi:MAG: hypothetical protein Q7S91_06265 [Aquabacterium sp.]|nr:hypothetical protein [Aquabacterium sp.]
MLDQRLLAILDLLAPRSVQGPDLILDQLQPRTRALDLHAQKRRHLCAVVFPPGSPVTSADNDVRAQVVQHQQRTDAVGVRNALVHQPCQFAVRAARVFGFGARFVQYRPHALTGMVSQQHDQQLVAVQAIGLGASGTPIDLDARGVDHDVVDALLDQPTVQPPTVAAGLVAGANLALGAQAAARAGLGQALQHCYGVAGVHGMSARTAPAVAETQLPLLVGQLEAHVQLALARRILALWGCLGRLHFRLLRSEIWKFPL